MNKDSGIRLQRDLHDEFLGVCRTQDRPAAEIFRESMRHYVDGSGEERLPLLAKRGTGGAK